jgi:hypothetical protein
MPTGGDRAGLRRLWKEISHSYPSLTTYKDYVLSKIADDLIYMKDDI